MSKVVKALIKYNVKNLAKGTKLRHRFDYDSIHKTVFELSVKVKANRTPLVCTFLVWLAGLIYYYHNEPFDNTSSASFLIHLALVAGGVRKPSSSSDFSNLYQLTWPIFVEVIVFGFLATAMLGQSNPRLLCSLHASHQKAHTIVIGYHHLGKRIVDHLMAHNLPFVVIDREEKYVQSLLDASEPVVIGAIDDPETLGAANVPECKEVFLVINRFQEAIVCCFLIRNLNLHCKIYVQFFQRREIDAQYALELDVFPFSSTEWATESLSQWVSSSQLEWRKALLLGQGRLATRFRYYMETNQIVFDTAVSIEDVLDSTQAVPVYGRFEGVSHVFVLWNQSNDISDTLLLTMHVRKHFPSIKIFVRCYDDMLAVILEDMGAIVFSTSSHAFKMLQQHVPSDSALKVTEKRTGSHPIALFHHFEREKSD